MKEWSSGQNLDPLQGSSESQSQLCQQTAVGLWEELQLSCEFITNLVCSAKKPVMQRPPVFMQDFFLCACMRPSSAVMLSIAPLKTAIKREKVESCPMENAGVHWHHLEQRDLWK